MKHSSLYIVLFLLGGTTSIFACEPKHKEPDKPLTKKQKKQREQMYKRLFDTENTNPIPEFVRECFEVDNTQKSGKIFAFLIDKYNDALWMTPYEQGYEINFKEDNAAVIQKMVDQDTDIAREAGFKLTLDDDNEDEGVLKIIPLGAKDAPQNKNE